MQVSAYSNTFRFRSFHALHIQNLSNSCRHKYDTSVSQIFQFSFLAGFLTFGTVSLCCLLGLCVKRAPPYSQFTSKTRAYCWEHTTTAHSWAKWQKPAKIWSKNLWNWRIILVLTKIWQILKVKCTLRSETEVLSICRNLLLKACENTLGELISCKF